MASNTALSLSPPAPEPIALDRRSKELRRLAVEAFVGGGRGHLGSAMSLIEILRVLYDDVLRFRATEPLWADRDRCLLSKGHGCLALYAILCDKGFFGREHLKTFCKAGSLLGGHPERGVTPGVEASTGALGHGLSIGTGMALAARMQKRSHRVFVIMGDGESNEGSVWEAAMSAAHHRLDNLVAITDANGLQSYGPTREVLDMGSLEEKWRSFGFAARTVDGHDIEALRAALRALPFEPGRPSALVCRTVKGKGIPIAENNASWHHKRKLKDDEMAAVRAALEDAP